MAQLIPRATVPVRQWVLSFPYPLRFLFASRPEALSRCLAVVLRAIEIDLIQRADLTRASGARTGAVTVVQRFGSALNLKPARPGPLHMLIPDGVYTFDQNVPRLHEVGPPPPESLERQTEQIVRRVYRRLVTDVWLIADEGQPWLDLEETDALDALRAASVRYRVALGPGAGRRTATLVDPSLARPETVKRFTVNQQRFSLNAAVACPADRGDRLERLCSKRVFEIDITLCPLRGGQLRGIADITDPDLIRKILDHVNSRAPSRLPPRRTESNQTPPDLFAER